MVDLFLKSIKVRVLNKKVKVLVSGAGGDVGQGVIKALNKSDLDVEIYTICVFEDSSFLHIDEKSFIAPYSSSQEYIGYLIQLMNKFEIDIFFPTVDSEILKIAQNKSELESKTGAIIFVDSVQKVEICDDKLLTYNFLSQHGFDTPKTTIPKTKEDIEVFVKDAGIPFIVKKRWDNGAKHLHIFNSVDESLKFLGNEDFIFQQYLDADDEEYTAGIYIGEDKEVKGVVLFNRELKCGSTYKARRILNDKMEADLAKVAKVLDMKYLNIQARLVDGKLYIFEFNGRLSGSTAIVSQVLNGPEMAVRELVLKQSVEKINDRREFVAMRYYEEIYADVSQIDTLNRRSEELRK